jgi:hypothetical protein
MKKQHNVRHAIGIPCIINILIPKGKTPILQDMKIQVRNSELTCIVIELLPAAILGTRATGVGAEGALLAELGGITVRRGTEERPLGTTGII